MTKKNGNHSAGSLGDQPGRGMDANQYFSSLPENVQEMIIARRESIKSEDMLYRPADAPPPRGD